MRLNTDGMVIREQNIGEADRRVILLTRDYGIVHAFARGARRIKSNALTATQLLSYSRFSIFQGRDSYIIDEAEPIEVFFALRGNMEALSLALYFAQLMAELAPELDDAEPYLRLILNTLHLLSSGKRPQLQLKAIFEMRLLSIAGYMPNLVACETVPVHSNPTRCFLTPCMVGSTVQTAVQKGCMTRSRSALSPLCVTLCFLISTRFFTLHYQTIAFERWPIFPSAISLHRRSADFRRWIFIIRYPPNQTKRFRFSFTL